MSGASGRKRTRKRKEKVSGESTDDYEYDYTYDNPAGGPPGGPPGGPRMSGPRMGGPPPMGGPRMSGAPPMGGPRMSGAPPMGGPRMGGAPPMGMGGPIMMGGQGPVDLPKKIELKTPGGPEISKFEKRKKKAKSEKITVFQDAANSCCIEVDDYGNLLSVMLSDDLNRTYLKFGQQTQGEVDRIHLQEGGLIPLTNKKKPFTKNQPKETYWLGNQTMYAPWDSVSGMGSNKKYKKVKIRKQKLKSKKAKVELLFAADKADLIVEEYTDKVGKIYVAFPDREQHRTYLFALPERLNVITEEFSRDIPIRQAIDDKANWYVQDTSSEESEEEQVKAPTKAETAINAVDDEMPGGLESRNVIGFNHFNYGPANRGPRTRLVAG